MSLPLGGLRLAMLIGGAAQVAAAAAVWAMSRSDKATVRKR